MKNMTAYPELHTIRDFIRFATSQFTEAQLFYGHGTNNPWDEAVALIFYALHLSHDLYQTVLEANLTKNEQTKLIELIHQRVKQRIPVPYLTHEGWFAGLSFYIDERVLIPRSPLAEMIENHFEPWILSIEAQDILDLCTGSGCIAIACAKAFPHAHIDASDISTDALAVAKINVLRHAVEEQVHLYEADLFTALPSKKYDIIISNPPYVDALEMATLPPEFLHEPKIGLSGGPQGLDIVIRILQNALSHLKSHGVLIVEVGNSEAALIKQFPHLPFTWLSLERSEEGGVFLITAEQLKAHQEILNETTATS